MQSVSSKIWTRIAVSISCDDNHYTTGTSYDPSPLVGVGTSLLGGYKTQDTLILMENDAEVQRNVTRIAKIIMLVFIKNSPRAGYDTRSVFKWSLPGLNLKLFFS